MFVEERLLGIAYGIQTTTLNISLAVFPGIVAGIVREDPGYVHVERFFCGVCLCAMAVCAVLWWRDKRGVISR